MRDEQEFSARTGSKPGADVQIIRIEGYLFLGRGKSRWEIRASNDGRDAARGRVSFSRRSVRDYLNETLWQKPHLC